MKSGHPNEKWTPKQNLHTLMKSAHPNKSVHPNEKVYAQMKSVLLYIQTKVAYPNERCISQIEKKAYTKWAEMRLN